MEIDAALRAYTDAKRVVKEARVKNLDTQQFASLHHKMRLARVLLDDAKYAAFLVLKTVQNKNPTYLPSSNTILANCIL